MRRTGSFCLVSRGGLAAFSRFSGNGVGADHRTDDASAYARDAGTVTGLVILEHASGPARFASVMLQPAATPETPADTAKDNGDHRGVVTALRIVHTTLDGSFLVLIVAPGNYCVMVDAGPYLSAAGVLTREQMDHPTNKIATRMT